MAQSMYKTPELEKKCGFQSFQLTLLKLIKMLGNHAKKNGRAPKRANMWFSGGKGWGGGEN